MMRRPGFVVATVFALGAMLGLVTSSVFLRVDATEIRTATETRASRHVTHADQGFRDRDARGCSTPLQRHRTTSVGVKVDEGRAKGVRRGRP
jgi:hypothetical protein